MPGNKILARFKYLFGIVNLVVGLATLLFFLVGPYVFRGLDKPELFSAIFFRQLAPGFLVFIIGIVFLIRSEIGYSLGFFSSVILFLYSFTGLLSKEKPLFLTEEASPELLIFCGLIMPLSASLFFGLQAISCFLLRSKAKPKIENVLKFGVLENKEIFCGNCQTRLRAEDSICPSCKAIIKGYRCRNCSYESYLEDFKDSICPKCGKKIGYENND